MLFWSRMKEHRAYFFNNQYLAGIHNGIQAGHALDQLWSSLTELGTKRTKSAEGKFKMLREFSKNSRTWIVLNAHDHETLADLYKFMCRQTTYPFSMFQEPGMNFANTSICTILPDRLFDDVANELARAIVKAKKNKINPNNWAALLEADVFEEVQKRHYTDWEREFLARKSAFKLAS